MTFDNRPYPVGKMLLGEMEGNRFPSRLAVTAIALETRVRVYKTLINKITLDCCFAHNEYSSIH